MSNHKVYDVKYTQCDHGVPYCGVFNAAQSIVVLACPSCCLKNYPSLYLYASFKIKKIDFDAKSECGRVSRTSHWINFATLKTPGPELTALACSCH